MPQRRRRRLRHKRGRRLEALVSGHIATERPERCHPPDDRVPGRADGAEDKDGDRSRNQQSDNTRCRAAPRSDGQTDQPGDQSDHGAAHERECEAGDRHDEQYRPHG